MTILTQIGGIIYLISILLIKKPNQKRLKRLGFFIGLYLFTTFLIVPNLAPFFGREKIKPEFDLKFVYSLDEFLFNLKSNFRKTNWLV